MIEEVTLSSIQRNPKKEKERLRWEVFGEKEGIKPRKKE